MPTSRLFADRRSGVDRRTSPRRRTLTLVIVERRRTVDLRRGAERRSTLDRRGRSSARGHGMESPGEHLRNALQLLNQLNETGDDRDAEHRADLAAVLRRVESALALLERRAKG